MKTRGGVRRVVLMPAIPEALTARVFRGLDAVAFPATKG